MISVTIIASCNYLGNHPKKVFNKIGLQANKIPSSFRKSFKEIRAQKNAGSLTVVTANNDVKKGVSAEEYVNYYFSSMFDKDIKEIKALKSDEESAPIITAGLALFSYADGIYKSDFPKIAKMIDENIADHEIDAAIEKLDNTKGIELDGKYNHMMELLLPYADKHGVDYEVKNFPF